ncbi:MAG: hypothetical protein GY953_10340 [bacterium]|nr:hypothetical protein [bacterium]
MRRSLLLALLLVGLGVLLARAPLGGGTLPMPGPATAAAGEVLSVGDGESFVTSDGPNAYLWRRVGDRLELLGQAARSDGGASGQAAYVWLPGVERGS